MIKKLIGKFHNLPIKRKLTYLYLPLAIIPMIIFACVSMSFYGNAIVKRSLASMNDNNILISDRINSIFDESESAATFLTLSINRLVNELNHQNDIKLYNLISNELSYAKLIYTNIDSIAFYDINSRLYYSDFAIQNGLALIADSNMMKELKETTGNSIWFKMDKRDYLTGSKDDAMLTLGKKIWNINTGETIGYLFINIHESTFKKLFDGQISEYYIYDEYGNELINSDYTLSENRRYLKTQIKIPKQNWVLESHGEYGLLTADLANMILLLIVVLLNIILLEIIMGLVLNRWLTSPINILMRGLEEIANGNFDFRFNMKTKDEIGLFAERYNYMSSKIKQLLLDVEREEKKKREYELALMQEQIKPHFLYNTLDIILKLSLMGQDRKSQRVTRRLADYYRKSLSGGADIITIKEEISLTSDYIELQKLRYSDLFDYKIDCMLELDNHIIPKLSLQPIVENAIEHGLRYKSEIGNLIIYEKNYEDYFEIIVEDDGIGMASEELNELRSALEKHNEVVESNGFGIKNVNNRIKLMFGAEYGVLIESQYEAGTRVVIKLPKEYRYD